MSSSNSNDKSDEKDFQEFSELFLTSNVFTDSECRPAERNVEHVFEELSLEAKYRSISVASHPSSVNFFPHDNSPQFKSQTEGIRAASYSMKVSPKIKPIIMTTSKLETETSNSSNRGQLNAPPQPFYVSPSTHFVTNLNIGDTKAQVEVGLSGVPGVAFEFFSAKCRWEGVYLVGSSRCKFEFNLYKRSSGGLIVAGNRLSGDSFAFASVYKAVHHLFDSKVELATPQLLPIPTSDFDLESHVVDESIDAVLAMASSGIGEAQVGASQIFCDLFTRNDVTHLISKYSECVSALVSLAQVSFEACDQHAICALANLSSSRSCQEVLIRDQAFLHSLLHLCRDGSFDTIEMRRECARLLANLSSGEEGARQVVASAGPGHVSTWLGSVQDLKDERLRTHANSVRNSLAACT